MQKLSTTFTYIGAIMTLFGFVVTGRTIDSSYYQALRKYWAPTSTAERCFKEQESGSLSFGEKRFLTLGLEGAGHHLIEAMPVNLSKMWHAGKQESIPYGTLWRSNPHGTISVNRIFTKARKYNKFLVLIRDPVDTWLSVLRRFWKYPTVDTLQREFDALNQSLFALHRVIQTTPCNRRLYLPYEMILNEPTITKMAMSVFLNVDEEDEHRLGLLDSWISKIKGYSHNISWPGPYPIPCDRKYSVLLEKFKRPTILPKDWHISSCGQNKSCTVPIHEVVAQAEHAIHNEIQGSHPELESIPGERLSICT